MYKNFFCYETFYEIKLLNFTEPFLFLNEIYILLLYIKLVRVLDV